MRDLGFLEKLLDGAEVEWKPLGDIAEYSRERISAEELDPSTYVGVDNLLQNRAGRIDSSFVPTSGNLTRFEEGDILIGNIRPYLRKIWLSDRTGGTNGDVLVIHPTGDVLSSRYLFQVLTDERFFEYNIQHSKGAKMPRGSKSQILEFLVPLPCAKEPEKSLAIQGEVVRILESFTELTAELTAELELRKKQYNHYRDQLLTFEDGEVEWKPLEEIAAKVSSGGTPSTGVPAYYGGDIPWLRTQEVDFGEIWDTEIKITEEGLRNSSAKMIPANCVIIAMYGATVGKIGINRIPMATNQACANIQLDARAANPRYVYHYLASKYQFIKSLGSGSQTNINAKIVKGLLVPIPFPDDPERSLAEQARIVAILDKFDTLTTSLKEGLPREIELRQKQYEYYRDLLLSFAKPAEAVEV